MHFTKTNTIEMLKELQQINQIDQDVAAHLHAAYRKHFITANTIVEQESLRVVIESIRKIYSDSAILIELANQINE